MSSARWRARTNEVIRGRRWRQLVPGRDGDEARSQRTGPIWYPLLWRDFLLDSVATVLTLITFRDTLRAARDKGAALHYLL